MEIIKAKAKISPKKMFLFVRDLSGLAISAGRDLIYISLFDVLILMHLTVCKLKSSQARYPRFNFGLLFCVLQVAKN